MFTLVGPHNAASFCNIPRCIEQNVEWVTALLRHMQSAKLTRVEPTETAEPGWTEHVHETAQRLLLTRVDSWMMGINTNVPGKQKRTFLVYPGGAPPTASGATRWRRRATRGSCCDRPRERSSAGSATRIGSREVHRVAVSGEPGAAARGRAGTEVLDGAAPPPAGAAGPATDTG